MAECASMRNDAAQTRHIFHNVGIFCGICVGYCGILRDLCGYHVGNEHQGARDARHHLCSTCVERAIITPSRLERTSGATTPGSSVCSIAHPCCLTVYHLASTFRQTNYPQGGRTVNELELAARVIEVVPYLSRSLNAAAREELGEALTLQQLRVLAFLRRHPGSSLGDLARWRDVSMPTMSKMIQSLVASGYVNRQANPKNRRTLVLTLTPKGEKVYLAILTRLQKRLAHMLADIPPETRERIADGLEVLADAVADVGEVRQHLPLMTRYDRPQE